MLAKQPRRTQEERSAATRARLLDATVECLMELGYAGTTTTEIAKRAGLSRGAQLHHFPTKAELVTEAVDHLFARRIEEFRAAFATLPGELDRATVAIDLLWTMFTGPTFYAALELIVAARTDAVLREKMIPLDARFTGNVRRTFADLFPQPDRPSPLFDAVPGFVFALMEGMALAKIVEPDDGTRRKVLDLLKALAPVIDQPQGKDGKR